MKSHRANFGVGLAAIILATGVSCFGNPNGGTVRQGTASFSSSGSQLTINTSAQAFISWQSFNIGAGETTTFVQPSSSSLVWNQINDPNPSQILGSLNANGYVVLQNQNGFFIGGQAAITAHGLIMTTSPIPMPDLAGGGPWSFSAPPPTASIINYGQINIGGGGSAFLIAHDIENHGSINAPGGNIGLYAGQNVLVSTRPDGRGLSATVTLPEGSVDNSGKLIADGGSIALRAQVVNQGGLVQANSVANVNGTIEFVASDAVNLGANSVISARGDSQGASSGGSVTVKAGNTFSDQAGSAINVAGGAQGGNGGQLEISATTLTGIYSHIDGHAATGFSGGNFVMDPTDLNLTSAFVSGLTPLFDSGLYKITLQADHNITLSTQWSLSDPGGAALLSLTAGNDIIFKTGSGINAGNNWSVSLSAGPQNLAAKPTTSRTDGIYLDGTSFIQTQNGDINLWAANEVLLNANTATAGGNGIRTLAGGNIDVTAYWGNVNTGGNAAGYVYHSTAPYYTVSQTLGGISTVAGGDVTITAGGDVRSLIPSGNSTVVSADAGAGAFGSQPGNVTITAGGNVFGHYVLANGVGTITAGKDAGALTGNPFALSLIDGSWNVNTPNGNIYLQEVRNPNGVFNHLGPQSSPGRYLFDYGLHDSLTLNAGIGVYLIGGQNVPRPFDVSSPVPVVYPSTLTINAGAGGITLESSVILYPSPYGNLKITTTDGGDFVGTPTSSGVSELIMSDSAQTRYVPNQNTFGDLDHAASFTVLNLEPVSLNIAGSMQDLTLLTTKETQIDVAGDMKNVNFSGQNLHADDITSIHVGGQIFYTSPYSFVFLSSSIPNLPLADLPPGTPNSWDSIFRLLMDPNQIANLAIPSTLLPSEYAAFANNAALFVPQSSLDTGNPGFVYNPATGRFGFAGPMPQSVISAFSQPLTVLVYDKNGFPLTTTTKDPVTGLSVTHFVTDTVKWAPVDQIATLFADSQGTPSSSSPQYGIRLGGPGEFDVHAGSISLGNSYGILSEGVQEPQGGFGRYNSLASVTKSGATLNVTTDGNLDMLTSTIASLGGGDVNVTSLGGSMDLGSQELLNTPNRIVGFGIYTSGQGDVNVIASGDININGSRIASYDGGNIFVESLLGNVNAGSGGATFIQVPVSFVDPVTGKAGLYLERVFGSGIIANTLVDSSQVPGGAAIPGNITVETPRGDIFASQGGIVQEALNGNVAAGPTVTLIAGTKASDGSPGFVGNIDLGTSGVIGGTVNATANGNITGLVISRQNSTINAAQTFSGTVLSGGTANLSASSVSGTSTIIGVGGVSVSGSLGVGTTVLGQNVSVNGGAAQSTLGTTAAASTTSQSAANTATADAEKQVASNDDSSGDDEKKKKGKGPALAHRVGRVTVLLPAKS